MAVIDLAKVGVTARDITNNELGEEFEFQYLDLNVHRNGVFGAQSPITMPNVMTRSFSIRILEVVYADHSTWKNTSNTQSILATGDNIFEIITDKDLRKQFTISYGEKAKFSPVNHGELWTCVCETYNLKNEGKCYSCNILKTKIDKFSIEEVNSDLEKRKLSEKAEEISAKKKAKKAKIEFLIPFLTISIVGITALFFFM